MAILLMVPAGAWIVLFLRRAHSTRDYAGSFLAYVWQMQASLLLNIALSAMGVWHFTATAHLFYGVPVEILIGQATALGAVNFLLLRKFGLAAQMAAAIAVLYVIYMCSALVVPQPLWWMGLLALGLFSVMPSLLLAAWTADGTHLHLRAALQALCWTCLLLWFFPSSIFQQTGHDWSAVLDRPVWLNVLYLLPLLVPAVLLSSALRQFAVEGQGTAFPYDPPQMLVTHGVYAHVSNPMQLGICLMMAWWGVVIESALVSLSAAVAVFLFVVFKDICNGSCAIGEDDPNWALYQKDVPKWIPRMTAWSLNSLREKQDTS